MGWFDNFKTKMKTITVSSAGGEWAAMAMACMVFADGQAEEPEIASAKTSCTTNPVIVNSIGAKKAEQIFDSTAAAIRTVPAAMLPTYEAKLANMAQQVKNPDDKNFALATVLAVAMADGEIEKPEYEMLMRFKAALGASIDVPAPAGA